MVMDFRIEGKFQIRNGEEICSATVMFTYSVKSCYERLKRYGFRVLPI